MINGRPIITFICYLIVKILTNEEYWRAAILLTWQKVAPLTLLSYSNPPHIILIVNAIAGVYLLFSSNHLLLILLFSGVTLKQDREKFRNPFCSSNFGMDQRARKCVFRIVFLKKLFFTINFFKRLGIYVFKPIPH